MAGRTVYFKEFGDPRIMDKRNGEYADASDRQIEIDNQANEIIDFKIGSLPYGEVRWIGQVLTVDGKQACGGAEQFLLFAKGRAYAADDTGKGRHVVSDRCIPQSYRLI